MKSKACEQRSYASDVTAEGSEIIGNPVVCGVRTRMYDYVEIIEPGALVEADISDVLLTVNHNLNDIPLARSKGGQPGETMQLTVDNYNCRIAAQLDVENNPQARALHSAVARGDITGMSFMFHVKEDSWERENDVLVRHIQKIDKIIDVSAVTIPAYPSTSISARSAGYENENAAENKQAEQRKKAERLELEKLKLKYMNSWRKLVTMRQMSLRKLVPEAIQRSRLIWMFSKRWQTWIMRWSRMQRVCN